MLRGILTLTLSFCLGRGGCACGAGPNGTHHRTGRHAIAIDAYVYFYSLVTMDITRKQFTNMEAGKRIGKGPMNMFVNVPEYPPANFKGVVRPNFDTLYSSHGSI